VVRSGYSNVIVLRLEGGVMIGWPDRHGICFYQGAVEGWPGQKSTDDV